MTGRGAQAAGCEGGLGGGRVVELRANQLDVAKARLGHAVEHGVQAAEAAQAVDLDRAGEDGRGHGRARRRG